MIRFKINDTFTTEEKFYASLKQVCKDDVTYNKCMDELIVDGYTIIANEHFAIADEYVFELEVFIKQYTNAYDCARAMFYTGFARQDEISNIRRIMDKFAISNSEYLEKILQEAYNMLEVEDE